MNTKTTYEVTNGQIYRRGTTGEYEEGDVAISFDTLEDALAEVKGWMSAKDSYEVELSCSNGRSKGNTYFNRILECVWDMDDVDEVYGPELIETKDVPYEDVYGYDEYVADHADED